MRKFLARDKDGTLFLYWGGKPHKEEDTGAWFCDSGHFIDVVNDSLFTLSKDVNPKWEDTEPIEVELIIKAINKEE